MLWHLPSQPAERITLTEVLSGWEEHNFQMISMLKPGKDDKFLLEQSTKDAARGFCSPPLTSPQLRQYLQEQPFRLIPRCVVTQSLSHQANSESSIMPMLEARPYDQLTPTNWSYVPHFDQRSTSAKSCKA